MAASIALVSALTGWLIARHMAPEPNFEADRSGSRSSPQTTRLTAKDESLPTADGSLLSELTLRALNSSGCKHWILYRLGRSVVQSSPHSGLPTAGLLHLVRMEN